MRIETGQGTISLKTLISVWTISAIISLPGLAVSPILGSLTKIFPHATDIEIQMLSSIPSLMIIPFILISGYLSTGYDKVKILVIGLIIYILSGVACIFAKSITMLIILSTILGVGAGMVIPLSTGFIANLFIGKYRTAQLGISSSIANLCLVVATFLTGWLAQVDWHLPFVVYLFPIVTLVMSRYLDESRQKLMTPHDPAKPSLSAKRMGLGKIDAKDAVAAAGVQQPQATSAVLNDGVAAGIRNAQSTGAKVAGSVSPASQPSAATATSDITPATASSAAQTMQAAPKHDATYPSIPKGKNYDIRSLVAVMLLYFIAGYTALTVIFNLPFVILNHKLDSSVTGTLMSLFFLAITVPGFFMNRIRAVLGNYSVMTSMLLIGLGLLLISLDVHIIMIGLGVMLTGLGYGFMQPFVYDKTTQTSLPSKSIIALAYVMAVNYLTIVVAPFIIDWLGKLLGISSSVTAPFMVSAIIALVIAVWAVLGKRRFVFSL